MAFSLLVCLCAANPAPVDHRTEHVLTVTRTNYLVRGGDDRTVTGCIVADRQRAYVVPEAFRDEIETLLRTGACAVEVAGTEGPRSSDNSDFRRELCRPRVVRASWPCPPVVASQPAF